MRTAVGFRGRMTRRQIVRLGGLIAFLNGRTPYPPILADLIDNGFLAGAGGDLRLTEEGTREIARLSAKTGLLPKYFVTDEYLALFEGEDAV